MSKSIFLCFSTLLLCSCYRFSRQICQGSCCIDSTLIQIFSVFSSILGLRWPVLGCLTTTALCALPSSTLQGVTDPVTHANTRYASTQPPDAVQAHMIPARKGVRAILTAAAGRAGGGAYPLSCGRPGQVGTRAQSVAGSQRRRVLTAEGIMEPECLYSEAIKSYVKSENIISLWPIALYAACSSACPRLALIKDRY